VDVGPANAERVWFCAWRFVRGVVVEHGVDGEFGRYSRFDAFEKVESVERVALLACQGIYVGTSSWKYDGGWV
jgi:hypothetical protein